MKRFQSLLLLGCFLPFFSYAASYNPQGRWQGVLDAGTVRLRIVFNISSSGGVFSATMDSPDQGAKGIKLSVVKQTGDSLFLMLGLAASFRGAFEDDSTIDGVWIQGRQFPLQLRKAAAPARPQTPVPTFPYKGEDITFTNADKSITYGATITAPADAGKHPALLLVTGSGQQNRDEEIMDHKPFAVIADYLTRRGYVVLRVDDRGVGKTTGMNTVMKATTADFALDAASSLDYLKTRSEVDIRKIGVLGHSEGGMIALMLAAQRKDLAFIISLAGPGQPNMQTMIEQNDALLEKKGLDSLSRSAYLRLYSGIMSLLPSYHSKDSLTQAIETLAADWQKSTPENAVMQTTGIHDEASLHSFATAFEKGINIPWIRYFISFDPAPFIQKISCKVLVLNGAKDIQVVSEGNLAGWRASLKKSRSKSYEVKELPGLNHLFQQCTRCDVDEYGELEQTIAPVALNTIAAWLDKEIK